MSAWPKKVMIWLRRGDIAAGQPYFARYCSTGGEHGALQTVSVTLTALDEIAAHPTTERNPDGVDQAAETMALLAREHAERIRGSR